MDVYNINFKPNSTYKSLMIYKMIFTLIYIFKINFMSNGGM